MIFYSRYKKFRIENNIDLKDISKRTKIDLKYLQSIEKGKFAELPSVYVKLFFKAYINEIGVDINEALHELDTFLNQGGSSKKLKFIPFSTLKSIFLKNIFSYFLLHPSKSSLASQIATPSSELSKASKKAPNIEISFIDSTPQRSF